MVGWGGVVPEPSSTSSEDDDDFEDQGSVSSNEEDEEEDVELPEEQEKRNWAASLQIHADDLSSDDEEGDLSRVGRVPLHWYEGYGHIGYGIDGEQVKRIDNRDLVVNAIAARDDPAYGRTIYDEYNNREIVISEREMELIRRIDAGVFPHPEFDAHPDYIDWATHEKEEMPLNAGDEPKSSFLPSKWEMMKVNHLIKCIRDGTIKPRDAAKQPHAEAEVYDMWPEDKDNEDGRHRKGPMHIPAPRIALPGHEESYRPPEEYLFTEEEEAAWHAAAPEDRPTSFIPKLHESLRHVAGFEGFTKERFERCLDLYLCPRALKRRLNIDPETLVPKLPKPQDLRPFPDAQTLLYKGSGVPVRSTCVSPDGQYLASGDEAGAVILWELSCGKELAKINLGHHGSGLLNLYCCHTATLVAHMAWNPQQRHSILAVAVGSCVVIIDMKTGGPLTQEVTEALLSAAKAGNAPTDPVRWEVVNDSSNSDERHPCPRLILHGSSTISWIAWQRKGDYLACITPSAGNSAAVVVHQLSRAQTQCPFKKSPGEVQCAAFHPNKPILFVATKRHVRVYHLLKQVLMKKLLEASKWISYMDVHPSGDHILLAGLDKRVTWFDMDLSTKPYRTFRYHSKAVRCVCFHPNLPLMASSGDDGTIHIFHSMVYSDLMQSPMIVPLKILRGHKVKAALGALSIVFHPHQPWLFSGGGDGTVRRWQDTM